MQRIVIFGATSAIATACAIRWVSQGAHMFLVGRDPGKLERIAADLKVRANPDQRIEVFAADLNEIQRHEALFEQAASALGGIDAVLIAHGTLPNQSECQETTARTLAEIHTNGLSVIALATVAGNRFEAQGAGAIGVISSVAGDRGRQSNYVYGAAKGMVSIFLQGMRNRLSRHGVTVTTIKPGFVDTPMTAGFVKKGILWAQPEAVAKGIVHAMARGRDEVYLPGFWRIIMLVIRLIPEFVFKRMAL